MINTLGIGLISLMSAFQLCISAAPAALDRYPRGFTGHVAHPIRSIQFSFSRSPQLLSDAALQQSKSREQHARTSGSVTPPRLNFPFSAFQLFLFTQIRFIRVIRGYSVFQLSVFQRF
jgi:hypothetical protein